MADQFLIEARGVRLSRAGRRILDGVSLAVPRRRIVTVIGPNGAGKTMLARVLLGLTPPDAGKVHRAAGVRIGYVPQRLTAEPLLPLTVARFLTLTMRADRDTCVAALARVDVDDLIDADLYRISGGELQRVLLARALLRRPDLLVLDEPAQVVDLTGQLEMYELIAALRDELGCGVLLISHDLHLVMAKTDEVVCLNSHVCCTGHPEAVSRHPEYLALFGEPAPAALAVYRHHHDHQHDVHGRVVEDGHD